MHCPYGSLNEKPLSERNDSAVTFSVTSRYTPPRTAVITYGSGRGDARGIGIVHIRGIEHFRACNLVKIYGLAIRVACQRPAMLVGVDLRGDIAAVTDSAERQRLGKTAFAGFVIIGGKYVNQKAGAGGNGVLKVVIWREPTRACFFVCFQAGPVIPGIPGIDVGISSLVVSTCHALGPQRVEHLGVGLACNGRCQHPPSLIDRQREKGFLFGLPLILVRAEVYHPVIGRIIDTGIPGQVKGLVVRICEEKTEVGVRITRIDGRTGSLQREISVRRIGEEWIGIATQIVVGFIGITFIPFLVLYQTVFYIIPQIGNRSVAPDYGIAYHKRAIVTVKPPPCKVCSRGIVNHGYVCQSAEGVYKRDPAADLVSVVASDLHIR